MAKQQTLHVLDYLQKPAPLPDRGSGVLFGDNAYLKTEARNRLFQDWFGSDEDDINVSTFDNTAQWADIHDEGSTASLVGSGGGRIAHVQNADTFVTE